MSFKNEKELLKTYEQYLAIFFKYGDMNRYKLLVKYSNYIHFRWIYKLTIDANSTLRHYYI